MDVSQFVKENNIKGAIFDMDGTLTDSMKRWSEIYAVLSEYLKLKLPQGFMMKVNHMPMRGRVKEIIKEFSPGFDENEVYTFWVSKAAGFYEKEFKIKPYMLETLKELKSLGVRCAIATASDKTCAEAFIVSNNLQNYISNITSLDEVSRPKSFPDIYIKAAQKLGVNPWECIVFEDALTAIKSAKSGKFYVCGVQDGCSAKDEDEIKASADFVMGFI